MEARRLRAWELLQKGWKQIEVAEALRVSRGAVSRWAALARQEGSQALRRRKPPGGPRKLKGGQLAQLPELLGQGPCSFGFSGEVWTRARIAQVIRQEFGISYHPTQVGRLLKECGISRQKPALRASQLRRWVVPRNPPQAEPREPERHQRRQHGRRTLPGGAGTLLQGGGDNQLSGAVAGRDRGQVAGDLGRVARLSQPGGEGMAGSGVIRTSGLVFGPRKAPRSSSRACQPAELVILLMTLAMRAFSWGSSSIEAFPTRLALSLVYWSAIRQRQSVPEFRIGEMLHPD